MVGKDFIDVAKSLQKNTSEPFWRSATSRAYYGAFNHARETLDKLKIPIPSNAEAHERIIRCLNNASNNDLAAAATSLGTLRTSRNHADYLDLYSGQKQATLDITLAEIIVNQIDKSTSNSGNIKLIKTAIFSYLTKTNQLS